MGTSRIQCKQWPRTTTYPRPERKDLLMLPAYHTAYIALGSNLQDRLAHLDVATTHLARLSRTPLLVSHLYDTAPMYLESQPRFVNGVARLQTSLQPGELLAALLGIESSMGRVRGEPNGPRVIDLDLLLWDDVELQSDHLTLPHPRLHERPFVLRPIVDLAPTLHHPALRRPMIELWRDLERRLGSHEQPVRIQR